MKFLLFIWVFLSSGYLLQAQDTGFSSVDHKMLYIPKDLAVSTNSIASFINTNFKTEREKFRAIYRWVTFNIKYDTDSMYAFNWSSDPERKITDALRRKKGVCENYAAIFNDIVHKCNLVSYVVSGYTKQSVGIDKAGHSWCAVYAGGEWLFCDPTWDEAYMNNPNYFLVDPSQFIKTHMPFDPLWQLLEYPITARQFFNGNFQPGKEKVNYRDSVDEFIKKDELQQLEASAQRIKYAGIENELTSIHLAYIKMQAAIIYESKDRDFYNSAVDDLNNAKKKFNDFIQYRNNGFTPLLPDDQINSMLLPVDSGLMSAVIKLDMIDKSNVNGQYDTGGLRREIEKFRSRLIEQNNFLNKYLSSELTERNKMFYIN